MRLGIYIGSFNPPHKGHIKVVNFLIENVYVDNVLIIPTLNYWDKQDLIDIRDRINMLKYFENEHIMVDDENNEYIYTIELMKKLESIYPNAELYLIIGADNIIDFHKWKDYRKLLKYKIIVMNRDNINIREYIKKLGSNNFIILDKYPYLDISSSQIRKDLNSEYLDPRVLNYIKENNLYRGYDDKENKQN